MTVLETLLDTLRQSSMTEREKGTYFEELILAYLRNEATYRDLYAKVWTWSDWAPAHGFSAKDDGIEGRQGFMQKTAVQLIHSESLRSIMPATG